MLFAPVILGAFVLAASILTLLAPIGVAAGQEGDARQRKAAAEAYDQGTAAYVARDYAKAAQWFETANRLSPAAPALIQSARAHYKAGNLPRAATLALQLTSTYADDATAMEVGQSLLAETAPQLVRIEVLCDGCSLDVGGALQEYKVFFLAPDTAHQVTASFETGEQSEEVSGTAGEALTLSFDAPPPPPPTAVATVRPSDGPERATAIGSTGSAPAAKPLPPLVTFIGAGLTGALLVGSIISTVDVYAQASDYEKAADASNAACQSGSAQCQDLFDRANQLLRDGEPAETRTTVLWIATGIVGVATAVVALTLTDWSGEASSERALRVQPIIDPAQGSAGLLLGARF